MSPEDSPPPGLLDAWRDWAMADASARGLPALARLLGGLAGATGLLRAATWNDDASRREGGPVETDGGH
jgi:hypothetical protein